MKKIYTLAVLLLFYLMTLPMLQKADAHVVVTPNEVGIGSFQTFTLNVPSEKDQPTISLRLIIPNGLKEVTPTVKSGWTVNTQKNGDIVKELEWTGGAIPSEERDEFSFSAQVPAKTATLIWKAYQTYEDGSVVSWDSEPKGKDDATGNKGPYSTTLVVDDLHTKQTEQPASTSQSDRALLFSCVAVALAAIAFVRSGKKN